MRWRSILVLLVGVLVLQTGTAAAASSQTNSAFALRVLELTNSERQKAGLKPLALSAELSDAAQKYSQVLASGDCFEHTCGPVASFADRIGLSGYGGSTALAENIAAGYPTPEAVFSGWMNSPGHRANLLSPNYTDVGIGLVSGSGSMGTYWAQEFGARAAAPQTTDVPAPAADAGAANSAGDASGS